MIYAIQFSLSADYGRSTRYFNEHDDVIITESDNDR